MTRRMARDLIVSINSTAGWKYAKARMLTDSEGNAAVFVPPPRRGEGYTPAQTFRSANGSGMVSGIRGTITAEDGQQVTYRRIGSSCGWALAKCNTKTAALVAAWPADPKSSPVPEDPAPGSGTRAQVATSRTAAPPAGASSETGDQATPSSKPTLAEMRSWAKEKGFEVKDRGALPRVVVDAYNAAHGLD